MTHRTPWGSKKALSPSSDRPTAAQDPQPPSHKLDDFPSLGGPKPTRRQAAEAKSASHASASSSQEPLGQKAVQPVLNDRQERRARGNVVPTTRSTRQENREPRTPKSTAQAQVAAIPLTFDEILIGYFYRISVSLPDAINFPSPIRWPGPRFPEFPPNPLPPPAPDGLNQFGAAMEKCRFGLVANKDYIKKTVGILVTSASVSAELQRWAAFSEQERRIGMAELIVEVMPYNFNPKVAFLCFTHMLHTIPMQMMDMPTDYSGVRVRKITTERGYLCRNFEAVLDCYRGYWAKKIMAERQRGSTSALQPGEDYGNSDGASGGSTGGGTDYDGKSETFKDSQGELGRGSASGGHTGGQNSGGVGAQLAVDDSGMFFAPGVGGMVYAVDFDSLRAIEEFRRWGDISTAEDNLIASRSVESWEEVDLGDETTHPIQQSGATPLEMYFSSIDFEAGYYDEYISVDDWEQIEEDWVEVRKEMVEKYEETTTSGNSDSLSRPTTPSPMPKGYDPMDWSPSFTYLST